MSAIDIVINAVIDFLIAYLIIELGLQLLQKLTNSDDFDLDWRAVVGTAVFLAIGISSVIWI